jgi:hypothetical protein
MADGSYQISLTKTRDVNQIEFASPILGAMNAYNMAFKTLIGVA